MPLMHSMSGSGLMPCQGAACQAPHEVQLTQSAPSLRCHPSSLAGWSFSHFQVSDVDKKSRGIIWMEKATIPPSLCRWKGSYRRTAAAPSLPLPADARVSLGEDRQFFRKAHGTFVLSLSNR